MLRILYADLRGMLKNTGFLISCASVAVYMTGFAVLMRVLLYFFFDGAGISGEDVMDAFSGIAVFMITAATLAVFNRDYSDGLVRNKITCGVKRSGIAGSAIICGCLAGAFISMISVVTGTILTLVFSEGFVMCTISEVAGSCFVNTLASMAVGAFSTMLVVVFGGTKLSYAIGFFTAFILKLVGMEVSDKLYPQQGMCMLEGAKLMIYRFYDRFVPYAHFSLYTRWSYTDYLLGSAALIAISFAIAIFVLNKKQIK